MNKRTKYNTSKITKRQILQNSERQNIESYRMAKDKRQIIQNSERQNVKSYRTLNDKTSNLTE
jgi:hypothetical protein